MTTAKQIKEGCGVYMKEQDLECGEEIETDRFESGCGFLLCPICQARLSQYKSDLQQELRFLTKLEYNWTKESENGMISRINFIKKELELLGGEELT